MSAPDIKRSIALVLNDHAIIPPMNSDDDAPIECLCGDVYAYTSRWAAHAAAEVVDKVLGGNL